MLNYMMFIFRKNKFPLSLIIKNIKIKLGKNNNLKLKKIKMNKVSLKLGNLNNIIIKNGEIKKTKIRCQENCDIEINNNVKLNNCTFILNNNSKIIIGEKTVLNNTVIILEEDNFCYIGKNVNVGGMVISGKGKNNFIKIGNNCLISTNVKIRNTDGHKIFKAGRIINENLPVIVEDNVWIGEDVTILKGVTIFKGSIVGSKTLVNKSLKKRNCIIAGIPARCVKENISWEK